MSIESGIYIESFWDMSAREILDYIKAVNNARLTEYRMNAVFVYKAGYLNGYAFNQPNKYPDIERVFPGMFKEERENDEPQDWRIMKARMMEYGERLKMTKGEK